MMSQITDDAIAAVVGQLPATGETISISATTSADNSAVLVAGVKYDIKTTDDCFVCKSATAGADDCTVNDYPIIAGETVVHTPDDGYLYVSAITASGTATVTLSPRKRSTTF